MKWLQYAPESSRAYVREQLCLGDEITEEEAKDRFTAEMRHTVSRMIEKPDSSILIH